ncbi:MAG: hypothetical protein CTY13_02135 [Methylobacter sp.]|nr:MAG: hypothetical protein CTY13_02135 [Methylobacter sp.]
MLTIINCKLDRREKKRHNGTLRFKINWGRGRLNKYESFSCFAAKFCRLNLLTPYKFRKFWQKSVEIFDSYHKQERLNYIARLLDEPLSVVRTVFEEQGQGWGCFCIDEKSLNRYSEISYCPECIADGFHGNFHESCWLRKCPIHYCDLIREPVSYSLSTKADRYLERLISLLDIKCPGWELSARNTMSNDGIKRLPIFHQFLHWQSTAQKTVTVWSDRCLGAFGLHCLAGKYESKYHYQNLDELMGRINWLASIPEELSELFTISSMKEEPEVKYFCNEVGKELNSLLATHSFGELIYFYKEMLIAKEEYHIFHKTAEAEISYFKINHTDKKCNCNWGINNRGNLVKLLPSELKYYGNYQCPYEFAANELYNRWFDLFGLLKSHFGRGYGINDINMLSTVGQTIASIINRDDENWKRTFKFKWSEKINYLFDTILDKIVSAHIAELKYWISSIEFGIQPNICERFPPNTYLVQSLNLDLQLISWQTRINKQPNTRNAICNK